MSQSEKKYIIIQGSARSQGNTHRIAKLLQEQLDCELIDLCNYEINPFDYEHRNREDDFIPLMRRLVTYDVLIFATPIYWYSMSSRMKIFFDRISDCLKIEKPLGRQLRGKAMAAIACGSDPDKIPGYFIPFQYSAEYLGMDYLGGIHTWIEAEEPGAEVVELVDEFTAQLKAKIPK